MVIRRSPGGRICRIIDHRTPIEPYRFDTTDRKRSASKHRRGNKLSMAGKEITRLFANDVFRSRNVSHDPPGRSLPRIDRNGLALTRTSSDVIRRLRSVERDELTRQRRCHFF